MKKEILLLLISILSISFFSACDRNVHEISVEYVSSTIINSETNIASNNLEISDNKHQELLDAVTKAETIYEWFYGLAGQPFKVNGTIVKIKENQYYEVDIKNVSNRDEFFEYLCTYFSAEIATELINTKVQNDYLFKDIDGKLYCFGGYAGLKFYSISEQSICIKDESDKKIIFTLTINATNNYDKKNYTASYDYIYEKQRNGSWVFTDFKLPYFLISDQGK